MIEKTWVTAMERGVSVGTRRGTAHVTQVDGSDYGIAVFRQPEYM